MSKIQQPLIKTPLARASYASVFKKAQYQGKDTYFEITLLIPKTDVAGLQVMKDAANKAIQDHYAEKGGAAPGHIVSPFQDGDALSVDRPNSKNPGIPLKGKGDSYKGMWVVKVKSTRRPAVTSKVSGAVIDVTETPNDFYSGCWVKCMATAWYNPDSPQGPMISFWFSHVCKLQDDEPFGQSVSSEDAFADDGDTSMNNAANYSAPPAGVTTPTGSPKSFF